MPKVFKISKSLFQELETELKIRGLSQRTIDCYLYENKRFFDFFSQRKKNTESQRSLVDDVSLPLQSVTQKDIKQYLACLISEKKLKPSSVNLALSALRFFFQEILNKDLFTGIKRPKKQQKLPEILSREEVSLMLDNTKNKKQKLLLELLYGSGLRVSEAVSLKIEDIDPGQKVNILKSGKGGKDRRIILSSKLRKSLQSYLNRRKGNNPYVFHYKESRISPRQAQRIVKNAALRAGIRKKVHCHMLRASFATHLLNAGVDIRKIQILLGHEKLSTTQIYTQVSTEGLEEITSPLDRL